MGQSSVYLRPNIAQRVQTPSGWLSPVDVSALVLRQGIQPRSTVYRLLIVTSLLPAIGVVLSGLLRENPSAVRSRKDWHRRDDRHKNPVASPGATCTMDAISVSVPLPC
jgi:hypothetical protein